MLVGADAALEMARLPAALLIVLLSRDPAAVVQASGSVEPHLLNPSTDPALAAAAPAAPAPAPLLWLPLGDSITWGCGTDAKPR